MHEMLFLQSFPLEKVSAPQAVWTQFAGAYESIIKMARRCLKSNR